jgi:hypothetical protein
MPVGNSNGRFFESDFDVALDEYNSGMLTPNADQLRDPMEINPSVSEDHAFDPTLEAGLKQDISYKAPLIGKPSYATVDDQTRLEGSFNAVQQSETDTLRRMKYAQDTEIPANAASTQGQRGAWDMLTGETGERYQTWPEKLVRDVRTGARMPGDVLKSDVPLNTADAIKPMADLAGAAVLGPAVPAKLGAKLADGTLGSFAGVKSKVVDKNKLYEANEMSMNGATRDEVWEKTGFFKGVDGRWRYEIDDSKATLNTKVFTQHVYKQKTDKLDEFNNPVYDDVVSDKYALKYGQMKDPTLGEILDHPELYKAYPELKDVKVKPVPVFDILGGMRGGMSEDGIMYLSPDKPEGLKSVIVHELQHWIQQKEGFAKGANTDMFISKELSGLMQEYDTLRSSLYKELNDKYGVDQITKWEWAYRAQDRAQKRIKEYEAKRDKENDPYLRKFYEDEIQHTIKYFTKTHGASMEELMKNPEVLGKLKVIEDGYSTKSEIQSHVYKKYKSVQGEVESRLAQERLRSGDYITPPYRQYDVPSQEQLRSPLD